MKPDDLKIEIIKEEKVDHAEAYGLSSIRNDEGEIESLYVEESRRNRGRGGLLVENALSWFAERKCKTVSVTVAAGYESVFIFYERFGFYPRPTHIQHK